MIHKTNVLKKNDFEKYEVFLPFSAALGKRRKKFLCSELEKMHPCFSDEFCFDSAVRKIGKKGIAADVLVMSKRKLAEYEGKRSFSGTGFFAEKLKHRYFVNEKLRLTGLCLIAFVMFCLLVLLCGKRNEAVPTSEHSTVAMSSPEITATDLSTSNLSATDIPSPSFCNSFFDVLKSYDGKVSFFEWKIEGFTESLSASLKGIYPEDLSILNDFRNRNKTEEFVSYEKGLPVMKVFYSQKLTGFSVKKVEEPAALSDEAVAGNADFNKSLRKIILEKGAVMTEEKAPPYHIEFICGFDSEVKNLFQEMDDLINLQKRRITQFAVNISEDGKISVGISIEPEHYDNLPGFDLNMISENLKVFYLSKVVKEQKRPVKTSTPVPANALKKIGEIKTQNNSTIVFYKNEDGKIERVLQGK